MRNPEQFNFNKFSSTATFPLPGIDVKKQVGEFRTIVSIPIEKQLCVLLPTNFKHFFVKMFINESLNVFVREAAAAVVAAG